MSLEISLLPEFGWSIKDQPVYGPGSVFQGFVKLNVSESQLQSADRLRVIFHATESAYIVGYAKPVYCNQLFGSQKVLWNRKNLDTTASVIVPNTDVSIPFIIQIPMVQFPPSSNIFADEDGLSYHCNYVLSASLERGQDQYNTILQVHKKICYMPFIETRISKRPASITTFSNNCSRSVSTSVHTHSDIPSVNVNMPSLDFVPGDSIPLTIAIHNIQRKTVESLTIRLFQIQTWNRSAYNTKGKVYEGEKKIKQTIIQQNIDMISEENDMMAPTSTSIEIPSDAIPAFSYSPVFSIKYQLQITIKRKGKLWSSNLHLLDVPINIGTLGYGIRSSEEIKIYSVFRSVFNSQQQQQGESSNSILDPIMPVPKFLEVVEYEESLPIYNNDRLPPYDASFNLQHNNQHMNCIM